MFLSDISADWLITLYYLFIFLIIVSFTKLLSVILSGKPFCHQVKFLFITPALSIKTWEKVNKIKTNEYPIILSPSIIYILFMLMIYLWVVQFISNITSSWLIRGYLSIVPFMICTEGFYSIIRIIFLLFKKRLPTLHNSPWFTKNISHFWGRHWNLIFSDWFRQICFQPFKRKPVIGIICAFFVSAIMHELLVNLPLFITFKINLFGSMFLYFLIQFFGIYFEKKYFYRFPRLNYLFTWAVILIPAPLILNQGTLKIFHFV